MCFCNYSDNPHKEADVSCDYDTIENRISAIRFNLEDENKYEVIESFFNELWKVIEKYMEYYK